MTVNDVIKLARLAWDFVQADLARIEARSRRAAILLATEGPNAIEDPKVRRAHDEALAAAYVARGKRAALRGFVQRTQRIAGGAAFPTELEGRKPRRKRAEVTS